MKIKVLILLIALLIPGEFCAKHLLKIGGAGMDAASDLVVDYDDSYIITGTFSGKVDFDPGSGVKELTSNGGLDVFLAKYDADDSLLWAVNFGGTKDEEVAGLCLDYLGDIYLAGAYGSRVDFDPSAKTLNVTSKGGSDAYLAKFDYEGNFVWAKSYGSTLDDYAHDVSFDILGYVYLTGIFQGTVDFNPVVPPDPTTMFTSQGGNDIFVVYLSEDAVFQWGFGIGSKKNDYASAIQPTSDGGFVLSGAILDSCDFSPAGDPYILASKEANSTKAFIVKYDFYTDPEWGFLLDGSLVSAVDKGVMFIDENDDIYIGGLILGTINFNPKANNPLSSVGGKSASFLAKYDLNGNYKWAFKIDNSHTTSICLDSTKSIILSGVYSGTSDFNPDAGSEYKLTAKNTTGDAYIAKYSNSGQFMWVNGFGSTLDNGNAPFVCSAVSWEGAVVSSGSFTGKSYFYARNDFDSLTSNGMTDIPIIHFKENGSFNRSDAPIVSKITLSDPKGGESFKVGTKTNINWISENVKNVNIEYRLSNGLPWQSIAKNVAANLDTYEWVIPNTPSNSCHLKISDYDDPRISDSTKTYFVISPKSILSLLAPNGGEKLTAESSYDIRWDYDGSNDFNIEIFVRASDTDAWELVTSQSVQLRKYSWAVPELNSSRCKIKIADEASKGAEYSDLSESFFTISPIESVSDNLPEEIEVSVSASNLDLTIRNQSGYAVKLSLIDYIGTSIINEVRVLNSDNESLQLNTDNLSNGVYYLLINLGDRNYFKKIMKN